jgi:hypothetical protein
MEKVYVVSNSCISNYEDCSYIPKIFKNLSDAKEYMKDELKDALIDMPVCNEKEEGEFSCEIWESGDYSRNHWRMNIQECEVN